MEKTAKKSIQIYTESTPNPETMKFVLDRMLLSNKSADFPDEQSAEKSSFVSDLFGFPFVQGVFVANNFVTITKRKNYEWLDIIPMLKKFIKEYIESEKETGLSNYLESKNPSNNGSSTTEKIIDILDTYIKPAVEMDGGAIQFKSYKEGVVCLSLQGACSGCPSSAITLKAGIENLLKQKLPEIKEVVADAE